MSDIRSLTRLTQEELDVVVEKHAMFRAARIGGNRATLANHDLSELSLRHQDLSHADFPWTYEQLVAAGVPPNVMNKEILSNQPEWPKLEVRHPALAIQANFIEGGLILCFAFHHAVADGGSFVTFLKAFAAATKSRSSTSLLSPVAKRLTYCCDSDSDILVLDKFPEYHYTDIPSRIRRPTEITNRIFTFSATTVQKLEEAIKDQLKKNPLGVSFVSNIACLSSLIWVAVIRARRARLFPDETTKMGIAVNARGIMDPKLPEE